MARYVSRVRAGGALVLVVVLAATGCSTRRPPRPEDVRDRVAAHFAQPFATGKVGVALPSTQFGPVGATDTADGASVTMWATEHTVTSEPQSVCFYIDVQLRDAPQYDFGGCTVLPSEVVSLNRFGDIVTGSVGSIGAATVRVAGGTTTVAVPVHSGYFLVPRDLATAETGTEFALTLLDGGGNPMGSVSLTAPGSRDWTERVS